ncbi:hypothetical protein [Alkalihalobacillus sp. LMS39]|uniref:hypothetical protein n=1 Tax=Alkalihalobacillus sp. LMS39 TaxID=2924032 RepID=UPI001FB2D60C|nr:hypothetical protein [Alkalihalobacillus sp. LMS39]UOE93434.1 hypothetical protein MM271_19925 [Alkalihalobacillus sp. LMS39]
MKMKQRFFLSLLVAFGLVAFALPRLPVGVDGLAGIFALSWIFFAVIVIAGNLVGLLYTNNKGQVETKERHIKVETVRNRRRYGR